MLRPPAGAGPGRVCDRPQRGPGRGPAAAGHPAAYRCGPPTLASRHACS